MSQEGLPLDVRKKDIEHPTTVKTSVNDRWNICLECFLLYLPPTCLHRR